MQTIGVAVSETRRPKNAADGFLVFERSYSQRYAEFVADLAALLDFFFGHNLFDNGQDDVRHVEFCKCCKFLQCVKRLDAESGSREGEEFFGGRRIQRNRNGVETPFEFRRDVLAVNQVGEPVRVEADLQFRVLGLELVDHLADVVQAFERLAVSAEHEFMNDRKIVGRKKFHDLFDTRFTALEPERVAFHHLLCLAQAENAAAWAAVGDVHVNVLAGDVAAVGDVEVAGFTDISCHSV